MKLTYYLIILFIILLFIGLAIQTANYVEVSVETPSQVIGIGQEFTVNISIDPATNPISGAQFSLVFDGSLAKINNISQGQIFKMDGAKNLFNPGVLNNSTGNLINVWGLIITPGANVTKKDNLAVITFVSSNPGTFRLGLTNVIICNPNSDSLPTKISNISFDIMNNSASPPDTTASATPTSLPDTIPPASVKSLMDATSAKYNIKWTWTDPIDPDFSKVMIYLNGKYITSVQKGIKTYNTAGLKRGTSYTLSTKTVDIASNINSTWVNHSARTTR